MKSALNDCAEDLAPTGSADRPQLKIRHVDFGVDAGVLTIDYVIRSGGPAALVQLGASLIGENGRDHHHRLDDRWLWVAAGTAVYRRYLRLAAVPRPGTYQLVVSASHGRGDQKKRVASAHGGEPLVLR